MPNQKALYEQLYKDQLYTNSYEDFMSQFGNEQSQKKLHDQLYKDQLYTNDFNSFKQDFFADVKKKDVGVSQSSSGQPIGLSASRKNTSAYNKDIESRDWQAHQALTRSLQESAQKNDAVGIKNAQAQLEQLRASNPAIASDPLLNEDLQTANKFIKAAPAPQQPAVKFPTRDRIPEKEVDKAIKGKAYVDVSQLVQPGNLNVDEKVSEFNKEFGSLGVRFEKTDNPIAGNFEGQITAIADNGEQMPVMIYRNEIAAKKEKEKLQEFLFRNSGGVNKKELTPTQFLSMAENGVSPEDENRFKRIYTKENVDKSLKFVNDQLQYSSNTMNDIKKEIDGINKEAEDIAAIVSTQGMTPELKAKADDIQLRYNEKSKEFENQKNHAKTVFSLADSGTKFLAAQNVKLLKEEGSIFGALYNSLLSGTKSLASGAIYAALEGTDILTMGLTNDAQKTQYEKDANKWLNDKFSELKLSSTTEEYKNNPDKKIRSALFSVPEMFPAFTIPGGFVAGMTLQGIGRRMEEYDNNPEMKNVPKEEKFILSGLNSFVEAKLENVGITQAFSKAGLANSLLLKSMAKWAPKSGINGLNRILNTEINNLAIKGALNTAGAMIAEGETGALQSATEMASNELYNIAKEKQIFKNPNTTKELLGKVWEDAEMEALGGMWMAGVVNIATNTYSYTLGKILDNQTFKLAKTIINDKATKASFVADLKTKIAKGEITQEKAQSLLTSFNEANAIVSQMPENISLENQRKAYDLIAEKRKLTSQIEGKDPNLTAKPKERIKQIDAELTNISNAAQEEEVKEPIQEEAKQKPVIKEDSQVKINEISDRLKSDIEFEKTNTKDTKYIKSLEDELELLNNNPEEYLKQKISELSKDPEFESSTNYYKDLLENLYAVQEQGSGQVPVQPKTGVSQEVEQGVPESKPQVVAEESNKELEEKIKTIEENKQNEIEQKGLNKLMPIILDESDPKYEENKKQVEERDLALIQIDKKYNDQIEKAKSRVQEAKAPSIQEEGTRLPEQKAEGVRGEPTIEEEAKKKSAFDQVEGGVEAKQKSLDTFEKTKKRGQKTIAEARENAVSTLKKTFAYERADDVQREEMERELRTELGEKLKKAPSVNKILGKIKDITKVTVNEATALKEQIKLQVKAAKDAVKYINELRKNLSAEIAALEKGGKITAKQAKTITNRLGKINLQNPIIVSKFVDYMTKVFNDAEYADKIRIANENIKKIKRLYKGNNVQATVSTMAKNFLTLDPKKLSDIDQYLAISNQVLQAVMRTQPAVIKDVNKYIEAAAKEQAEKVKNDLLLEYQYLVDAGILDDSMSYEDILEVIDGIEDNSSQEVLDKGEDVRQYLVKMFNSLSAIGKEILESGVDPVTGLPVDLSDDQKIVLKQFLNMDIENMSIQDAKLALEYLSNFITNGITDGMGGLVQSYVGSENFKKFQKTGAKFRDLKLFFSSKVGRGIGEYITNLNILLEQALGGQDRSAIFRTLSGFNDIVNGNAKARKVANQKLIQYVEKFKGVKDFFTVENNIERGILSFLIRTNETKEELERRKGLIEQSIEKMMKGDEKEVAKAKIIQETYERIGKNAKTVQDVIDAAGKDNREAVNWWINNWGNDYNRLKDLSLNIYNADLGKDQNYTPDVYNKTDDAKEDVDNLKKSAFMMTTKDYTVKKKTGVLMEALKPSKLNSNRVVSFDFDTNNARAYEAAMVDLETAAPIRRIDGFMNSKEFSKLGKGDDVALIKRRINGYIGEIRGKNYVSKTSIQEINKTLDAIGSIGAALALGGVTQPVKQIAPVAINTFINTGGMLDITLALNKDVNNWIDELGMPIGNRGIESLLTVNTANKYLEEASKHKGQKALDLIKKASEVYLNFFLKKPDVFIARASFISYYKKQLKKKGVDVSKIDWATHKADKAAAQYAQDMVDRQQNVSDAALMGDLMTSKDPWKQVIRKTTLTFMNFVLNQKARMYSDVITLRAKDSTEEDKKMARRSLAALSVEMSVYSVIGGAIAELIRYASALVMGEDETEEQKAKRRKSRYELVATNISKDFLSPIPFTDAIVVGALNEALDQYYKITKGDEGDEEGDRFRLFEDRESSIYDNLGSAGISFERLKETIGIFKMASTGEFEQEFIPGKRTTKFLRDRDKQALAGLGLLSLGTNLGLLPSEIGSMIRTSVKIAKKRALTESKNKTRDMYKSSNAPLPDYLK